MRDDRQRLVDILDAIDRIDRHTRSGRTAFERDELVAREFTAAAERVLNKNEELYRRLA